jgi:hypothetical protein
VASFVENWNYTFNNTAAAPPANSQVRFNAAQALATKVWVHISTKDGRDVRTLLLSFQAGAAIYLQDQGNSANWVVYRLTGPPLDLTTYVELPVTYVDGGGAIVTAIDLYGTVNLGTPAATPVTGSGTPGVLAQWATPTELADYGGTAVPPPGGFVRTPWSQPTAVYSVLVVPPSEEPLTLPEAKLRAALDWPDGDPRDALMRDVLAAARAKVELDTELALLTQTRDVFVSLPVDYVGPFPIPAQCTPAQSLTPFDGGYRVVAGWPSAALLRAQAPLLVQAVGLLVAHWSTLGRDLAVSTSVALVPQGYAEAVDAHRLMWVP